MSVLWGNQSIVKFFDEHFTFFQGKKSTFFDEKKMNFMSRFFKNKIKITGIKILKKTQKDFCIKYIVLGSDAFNELHLWKDYIQLIKSYHFIVINRIGNKLNKNQTNNNKLHIIKK